MAGGRDSGNLELLECLLVALRLGHLQRVELHRLGERPALAHRHHVADLQRIIFCHYFHFIRLCSLDEHWRGCRFIVR